MTVIKQSKLQKIKFYSFTKRAFTYLPLTSITRARKKTKKGSAC